MLGRLSTDHRLHDNFLKKLDEQTDCFDRVVNFVHDKPQICSTYPREFLVPHYLKDNPQLLTGVISFREK